MAASPIYSLKRWPRRRALLARQARVTGFRQPIVAIGSVYSPKFIELGGSDVNGVYTECSFFPSDSRPEVQSFVRSNKAK